MKNLLVDALRQSESGSEAADTGIATESPLPDVAGTASALNLSDTVTMPVPAYNELSLAIDDVFAETVAGDVKPLAETQAAELASAVHGAGADRRFSPEERRAPGSGRNDPALFRAARFTPLLALLSGSLSGAAYVSYATIGASPTTAMPAGYALPATSHGLSNGSSRRFSLNREVRQDSPPRAVPERRTVAAVPPAAPLVRRGDGSTDDDKAYPLIESAYAAWRDGDVDRAVSLYEAALVTAPRHPNALAGLGAVLMETGERARAEQVYATLLSVEPENATAAAALLDADDATVDRIRTLLTRFGRSAPLHAALGKALARNGRWADARVAYADALALAPERADYAYNLAVAADRLGQYRDASGYYRYALALGPDAGLPQDNVVAARLAELRAAESGGR